MSEALALTALMNGAQLSTVVTGEAPRRAHAVVDVTTVTVI